MQLLIISITESSHQGYRLPPNEEVPEIPTIYEPYSGVQFGNTIKDENNVEKTGNIFFPYYVINKLLFASEQKLNRHVCVKAEIQFLCSL